MSQLSTGSFLSKWAALFADNTTRDISEEDMRDFRQDISDSFINIATQAYYGAKAFNHGVTTITQLKAVLTVSLPVGVCLPFTDTGSGNIFRFYELIAGTTAESSPNTIRPSDYAGTTNEKVWRLASQNSVGGGSIVLIGTCDLTSNALPSTGGTGLSGAVMKGNAWVSTAGATTSLTGQDGGVIPNGSLVIALVDSPNPASALDWIIINTQYL